jgi:hypothetical protein
VVLATQWGILLVIDRTSEELKRLKVRYGELNTEEDSGIGGRKFGFGTVEETLGLRRGKRTFE